MSTCSKMIEYTFGPGHDQEAIIEWAGLPWASRNHHPCEQRMVTASRRLRDCPTSRAAHRERVEVIRGTSVSAIAVRGVTRHACADEHPGWSRQGTIPGLSSRSGLSSLRELTEGLGMRINYEIPDDLHHRAKALAALEGKTLREFIVEALAEAAARREGDGTATGDRGRDA